MTDRQTSRSAAAHDAAFGPDHPDAKRARIAEENTNGEYGALDGSHPRHADKTGAAVPSDALAGVQARDAHEHAREG